jgi:hypothetical protein
VDEARRIPQAAIDGLVPEVAESLLADARYLAHWAPLIQNRQSILLAAMACELKGKAMLKDAAGQDRLGLLLNVVLENPRTFPQAAHELFDSLCKAVLGRSLKDDNRPLFKRLRSLFELRNRVAHRGEAPPGADETKDLVRTATEVFKWVDDVRNSPV